jgi:hypothetical protein
VAVPSGADYLWEGAHGEQLCLWPPHGPGLPLAWRRHRRGLWVAPARGLSVDSAKLKFTVYPAPQVSTANCILATRGMIDYTDCPFMVDKRAPHDLCSRAPDRQEPQPGSDRSCCRRLSRCGSVSTLPSSRSTSSRAHGFISWSSGMYRLSVRGRGPQHLLRARKLDCQVRPGRRELQSGPRCGATAISFQVAFGQWLEQSRSSGQSSSSIDAGPASRLALRCSKFWRQIGHFAAECISWPCTG